MQDYKTIQEWQETIGENIRNLRLQRNLDQRDLARQAGVSLTAVKRLESGKASTTKTLIAIVRILNRTDWLNSLAPTVSINPMAPGNLTTPRQRVFKERKSKTKVDEPMTPQTDTTQVKPRKIRDFAILY